MPGKDAQPRPSLKMAGLGRRDHQCCLGFGGLQEGRDNGRCTYRLLTSNIVRTLPACVLISA